MDRRALSHLDHAMQSPQTEARIAALEEAVKDIRDAVVTIARLEERHAETREAINRCFQVSEKNAEAILAAKSDASDESAALRTEVTDINLKLAALEGRIKPLEEAHGFLVTAAVSVLGLVGAAVVGLVLVK